MGVRVTTIGEVLWDVLPAGREPGGAPANVAVHAHALGADARLVSRVGADPAGRDLLDGLTARGVHIDTVQVDLGAPTGSVDVVVGADGQPAYRIADGVAWDRLEPDAAAREAVTAADAVVWGTLAQRTDGGRRAVQELVAFARPDTLRVFDVNLRPPFWSPDVVAESLALADVLKLNGHELPIVADVFGLAGDDRRRIDLLAARFRLKGVALTRGSAGCLLWADGTWAEVASEPVTVRDTVGAGDSFTAALTLGLLAGRPPDRVAAHANAVAAYVCTQAGATPPLPPGLRAG